MYFYDIMLLYNRYEQYVSEENERAKTEQEEYENSYQQPDSSDISKSISDMSNKMGNINLDSISKGMVGLG